MRSVAYHHWIQPALRRGDQQGRDERDLDREPR